MKDYALIRYLAKMTGAKLKNGKDELTCYFPYSDNGAAFVQTHIIFDRKQSVLEFFDLTEVYNEYGGKYGSYEQFVEEFVERNDYLESAKYNGVLCVQSDLTVNKLDHTASPALVNYSLVIIALNKMLGRNEIVIREEQWRTFHRDMLKKFTKKNRLFSYLGIGAFIGGIALFILGGNINSFTLVALSVLVALGGLIATPIFFLRSKYYNRLYKKALNERHY